MRAVWRKRALVAAAVATLSAYSTINFYSTARADTLISSFTPGDLVVLRGGDATNQAGGATETIGAYLDEYTPDGVYQGTIDMPQSAVGSNNPLTITNGPGNHEGILTLSANGNWLTFGGYDTAPTTDPSGAGISNITLGEISQNASTLNTSTLESPATVRASVTVDGNEFWVSNSPGLQYINGTGSNATDTTLSQLYNTRALQTVNSTLITGSGSSSLGTHGVWQLGSSGSLPTGGTPSKTLLTSGIQQDGTDFVFADEPGDSLSSSLYEGMYNVLYSVGGASGSSTINKYEYNGSAFVLLNSETPVAGGGDILIGVTDIVSGGNVNLFYTDNSGIYRIVDANNADSALPNDGSLLNGDSAPSNEFFYGIAQAPKAIGPATLTWNNAGGSSPADGRTWDIGSNNNWNSGSVTTVYTDGSNVVFNDSNNATANGGTNANAYSVTLNTTVSPGSIAINNSAGNYTISGSGSIAGSAAVTKSGSGVFTMGTANTSLGAVSVTAGTLQLGTSAGLATVTSLAISGSGKFDVNNNHVIINYGSGADPIASIAALLATGYAHGAWNGAGGIVSSAAAANADSYGLGYADSADTGNPAGLSSGTIEIKYTLLGDANLSGVVDGTDFGIVAANFNKGVSRWDEGDFNYDNTVDGTDFGDLAANFNKGASGAAAWQALEAFAAANGLLADVPEPGSIAFLAVAAVGILSRRRNE
jgi:fibronectin-binding autotransporter adhesin